MKNMSTMEKCPRYVSNKNDICGLHKRRKLIYLLDGSIWNNPNKSSRLEHCHENRPPLLFWKILPYLKSERINWEYFPDPVSKLRDERKSSVRKRLILLGVDIDEIPQERQFWFLNLLYYLGHVENPVRVIQRFYRGQFKKKQEERKKAIKVISKYYSKYKMKKNLPLLVKNGKYLRENKCINHCDPVTQDMFVNIPTERWVICKYADMEECWWFDVSSAIQLLGAPGSYASTNPFNRRQYPAEFLFDIEEKLNRLKDKYQDLKNLTLPRQEDSKIPECFSYPRFLIHIKSNTLFESFKEGGYFFPREAFLKYGIRELRYLCGKILENWNIAEEEERIRLFPPDGEVFPLSFIERMLSCSNSIVLRTMVLNTLLQASTYQQNIDDRLFGSLKILMILGTVNRESHFIIHENNLCDCF
jgi:hypothetical protein